MRTFVNFRKKLAEFKKKPAAVLHGKLAAKGGFSLSEVLVTLLIFGLMIGFIATGITSAFKVYRTALYESESENLIATVNTELSDLLRFADNVTVDEASVVLSSESGKYYEVVTLSNQETFEIPSTSGSGTTSYYKFGMNGGTIGVDDQTGHLSYTRYSGDSSWRPLVSSGIYGQMTVSGFSLGFNQDTGTFVYSYTVTGKYASTSYSGAQMVSSLKCKYQ